MPVVTPLLALAIVGAGAAAGSIGVLLGIGGGIFLVPLLNLAFGFPVGAAAAISLTTVIATSTSVTARRAGEDLINVRLGIVLETATAAGSVLGGVTAQFLTQATIQRLFAVAAALVAVAALARIRHRNVLTDQSVDPGILGGRFHDVETGARVVYRIRRLPLALAVSFVAGNISSLLGIGGGVIKVPVLNAWCGVPMRVAAATSAFMIGVTATGGAVIYVGAGQLVPAAAAAAVLGVQLGSWAAFRVSPAVRVEQLKLLLVTILAIVAVLMFVRGMQ
jgi:uncharacterized membrane protein YfcA